MIIIATITVTAIITGIVVDIEMIIIKELHWPDWAEMKYIELSVRQDNTYMKVVLLLLLMVALRGVC